MTLTPMTLLVVTLSCSARLHCSAPSWLGDQTFINAASKDNTVVDRALTLTRAILDGYLASIETNRRNLPAKGLLKKVRKDMESKGL